MTYHLGIDLGTTYTAAAVCRPGRAVADVVPLGDRSSAVPSAVSVDERTGFLFGTAAERRALSDPALVATGFKRRIGDAVPIRIGDTAIVAEELAARFVRHVVEAVAAREDEQPAGIAVTRPASWGPHRLASLRADLTARGLGSAVLLPEPQAAAIGYTAAERVRPGAVVAVYDLGGGTFDAAVLRKGDDGGFELLGRPEGIDGIGGLDFDEAVLDHVRAAVGAAWDALDPSDPAVLTAVARLRRECAEAKEALSADTEVVVPVVLPGLSTQVRLTRAELEDMIRPAVAETVGALRRALDSAGIEPEATDAVLLVGGSSRVPLVAQLVSEACGRPVSVDVDPKGVIAAGAATAVRDAAAPQAPAEPRPAQDPDDARTEAALPVAPPRQPHPPVAPPPVPKARWKAPLLLAAAAALVVGGGGLAGAFSTPAAVYPNAPAVAATPEATPEATPVSTSSARPAPTSSERRREPAGRSVSQEATPTTSSGPTGSRTSGAADPRPSRSGTPGPSATGTERPDAETTGR